MWALTGAQVMNNTCITAKPEPAQTNENTQSKSTNTQPKLTVRKKKTIRRRYCDFIPTLAKTKKIESLILSGTNIIYTPIKIVLPVKYLDISNTTFAAYYNKYEIIDFAITVLQNVETFNVSYVPSRVFGMSDVKIQNYIISESLCHELPRIELKLRTLDLSYMFDSVLINNCTIDFSDCLQLNNLQFLIFRGNNLKKLNATLNLPKNMHLVEVDLSFNQMEYISPNAIKDCSSLLTFSLNNNKLVNMEKKSAFLISFQQSP